MKKECREKKYISPYMDGELSPKGMNRMEIHLRTCPECRKEVAVLQSLNSFFREMKEIAPSQNFARGFWQKLANERAGKINWDLINPLNWGWQPSVMATVMVILIVCGIFFTQKTSIRLFDPVPDSAFNPLSDIVAIKIAENLDLYQDMELISQLEMFENWDAINRIEEI